jgi:Flp pilus assembly protein TadG
MQQSATLNSRRASRGSALLESALVLLGFAALVIGTFDFAQFLFIHQSLVERARNAARWGGLTSTPDTTSVQNMVLYNQPTVPQNAQGYMGLTTDMVQVTTPDSGTDDYRVVVLITNYPYQILSPYIAGRYYGPDITVSVPLGMN